MVALPGVETQLELLPPEQVPTAYDLVVVIDAGLKSKVTGHSEITFKVTEDNMTRIVLKADDQVKVPKMVLVKGSDGKEMKTLSSRSRDFIIIETEEALREAESYVLKMEYEATVDEYPAAITGLMKSQQGRSEKLRLANVACLLGWQRCGEWVVDQLHIEMSDIEDRAYE
ncbi:hypothetical protein IscW_ISCW011053 [Ixodes scapularis]|uniref:Aminopeptidase N-like N-terminal domain-containing protein n=1 Tax=Ixodes scapularis TaxID=6945 RepID=B7Q707_IXOSC|nr:hypothetical protein IscW_ISCW011053 [Ixodes scapularis]|eukprot:XP_002412068.1 hypothetical protein IscW_ISCW011053 [Ixodes scapularis]